jgi:sugar-specific transcriptional regulator TrmB
MNKQFENLFNSVDLPQKWNTLALSSVEQWIALGFDSVQESVESASQQLKAAWSGLDEVHEPSRWSEIAQAAVRNTIESTRELMCAATNFQIEAQQLFRDQAAEAHKLVEASLTQQFSDLKSIDAGARQGNKTSAIAQKLAA